MSDEDRLTKIQELRHRYNTGKVKLEEALDLAYDAGVAKVLKHRLDKDMLQEQITDYVLQAKHFPLVEGQLVSMVILHFNISDKEAEAMVDKALHVLDRPDSPKIAPLCKYDEVERKHYEQGAGATHIAKDLKPRRGFFKTITGLLELLRYILGKSDKPYLYWFFSDSHIKGRRNR